MKIKLALFRNGVEDIAMEHEVDGYAEYKNLQDRLDEPWHDWLAWMRDLPMQQQAAKEGGGDGG